MFVAVNIASLANQGLLEAIDFCAEGGFQGIELLAFEGYRHRVGRLAGVWPEKLSRQELERLRGVLNGFRLVALHAPFIELAPVSLDGLLAEASWRRMELTLRLAQDLDAEIVTTHAIPVPTLPATESLERLVDYYKRLGDAAAGAGVKIGIETGWPAPSELMDMVEQIDHPAVGVTIDVGHLVSALPEAVRSSPDGPKAYNDLLELHVREAGPWIVHVHVHDVDRTWRDHRCVGAGIIDWPRLVGALKAAGYDGALSLELEEADTRLAVRESAAFLEKLL